MGTISIVYYPIICRLRNEILIAFNVERRKDNMGIEFLFRLLFLCIMVFALGCVLGAFVMAVEHFFYERARHKKVLEVLERLGVQDVDCKSKDE